MKKVLALILAVCMCISTAGMVCAVSDKSATTASASAVRDSAEIYYAINGGEENDNVGNALDNKVVRVGDEIPLPDGTKYLTAPEGKAFGGWSLEKDSTAIAKGTKLTQAMVDDSAPSYEIPLFAVWTDGKQEGGNVTVDDDVKDLGITEDKITANTPADTTLSLKAAASPAVKAEDVVENLKEELKNIQVAANAVPVYLDITLLDKNQKPVQPGTAVEIKLPIPYTFAGISYNSILVIHYEDDGTVKDTQFATLSDGHMTFAAQGFSTYAFLPVDKTAFDVEIVNVKGGVLDIIDDNGIMLPVGKKVSVPSKAETRANSLRIEAAPLPDAQLKEILVNGETADNLWSLDVDKDLKIEAVFEKAEAGEDDNDWYHIICRPDSFTAATKKFSGSLAFYYGNKELGGAKFEFVESANDDSDLFEISGNTLTSKKELKAESSYQLSLKVTVGDQVYVTGEPENADCYVSIHYDDGKYYVGFVHYLAEQFLGNSDFEYGYIGSTQVAKGASLSKAVEEADFYQIKLDESGKPQMYGYEFANWKWYRWNSNDDLVAFSGDKVEDDLTAVAMFKDYRVDVQSLGGGSGNGNGNGGGSSGGGGSSSSGGNSSKLLGSQSSKTTGGTAAGQPAKAADVSKETEKAISAAVAAGSKTAAVTLKNVSTITPAILNSVAEAAAKAGLAPMIYADTMNGNAVAARLYMDPSKNTLTTDLNLNVSLEDKSVQTLFEKYFSNTVKLVKFAQKGTFGMTVQAAVKLDLSELNTAALRFYTYDVATNQYVLIANPQYSIDVNGYLHFYTNIGNHVIITDKPLTLK